MNSLFLVWIITVTILIMLVYYLVLLWTTRRVYLDRRFGLDYHGRSQKNPIKEIRDIDPSHPLDLECIAWPKLDVSRTRNDGIFSNSMCHNE